MTQLGGKPPLIVTEEERTPSTGRAHPPEPTRFNTAMATAIVAGSFFFCCAIGAVSTTLNTSLPVFFVTDTWFLGFGDLLMGVVITGVVILSFWDDILKAVGLKEKE